MRGLIIETVIVRKSNKAVYGLYAGAYWLWSTPLCVIYPFKIISWFLYVSLLGAAPQVEGCSKQKWPVQKGCIVFLLPYRLCRLSFKVSADCHVSTNADMLSLLVRPYINFSSMSYIWRPLPYIFPCFYIDRSWPSFSWAMYLLTKGLGAVLVYHRRKVSMESLVIAHLWLWSPGKWCKALG